MVVEKVIQNVVNVAITTAITVGAGALCWGMASSNKVSKENHKARMKKLQDEYDEHIKTLEAAK